MKEPPDNVNSKYPLYPELPEGGAEVVQKLMDRFKDQIRELIDNTLGDLYVDVTPHVESDHWMNYRNSLEAGLIWSPKSLGPHRYKELRDRIYKENKEKIVKEVRDEEIEELSSRLHYTRMEMARLQEELEGMKLKLKQTKDLFNGV